MRINFVRYKNSFFATVCSLFGSLFIAMSVLLLMVFIIDSINSKELNITDMISMILSCVIIGLIGIGLERLARKISENKTFMSVKRQIEEKGLESQISSSVSVAVSAYNLMPCKKMFRYICLLNPSAREIIEKDFRNKKI